MTFSIEQVVLLKLLNGLGTSFSTYMTILNEQGRRDKSFPKLDELLKNHEDEKSRLMQDAVGIANVISKAQKFDQSIRLSDAEMKNLCLHCGKWHEGECRFIKTRCNKCNEIRHISRICRSTPKEEKNEQKKKAICILTGADKTAAVKQFPLTVNSFNAISQPRSTYLYLDSTTTDHSIFNKDLFMNGIYKEAPSYLDTRSKEWILSEVVLSVLVPLPNRNGCRTELIFTQVRYSFALGFHLIGIRRLGKKCIGTRLQAYSQPSDQIYREKILRFADSIDQQYHIRTLREDESQILVTRNYKSDLYLI